MKRSILLVIALTLSADQVYVQNGFQTGQSFRDMGEGDRTIYAMGYIDGLFSSSLAGASHDRLMGVHDCIQGMTSGQLRAVFEKIIASHPERWDERMSSLGYSVLVEACRARGKPIVQ